MQTNLSVASTVVTTATKNSTNQGGAGKPKGNREDQGRAHNKPDDRKPNGNKPNGNKQSGNKPNGNKSGNAGKPSGNRKPNNAKPAGNKPSGQRRKPRPQAAN